MPKNPGPPPRAAQNTSGRSAALAVISVASAMTTSTASIEKQAMPQAAAFQPMPPPSRWPLTAP